MDQSNNPHFIRAEVERVRTPGHPDFFRYHYQFLHYPGTAVFGYELNVVQRFEEMAELLRARIAHEGIQHILLTLNPHEAHGHYERQRIFHSTVGVTGSVLHSIFEGMVQSQETLELEGFVITLEDASASFVEHDRGGFGRASGTKLIPEKLRGYGLAEHPLLWHWRNDPSMQTRHSKNCGFRALLLAHPESPFRTGQLLEWFHAAEQMALLMDPPAVDGKLTLGMLPQVFADADWWNKRIVVMSASGDPQTVERGRNWVWLDGHDRAVPDPNTVMLLLHDQHYYWIHTVPQFMTKVTGNSNRQRYPVCYRCFKHLRADLLEEHDCVEPIGNHQCTVCLEVFAHEEGLRSHRSQYVDGAFPPCEICGRSKFFGEICRRRHMDSNCRPRREFAAYPSESRAKCSVCFASYFRPKGHTCPGHPICSNCEERSDENHHCRIAPPPKFWQPIGEQKSRKKSVTQPLAVWNSHWAYDFETYQFKEIEKDKAYELAVMAWAVRLMIPDEETWEYVEENEVFTDVRRMITYDGMLTPDMPEHVRGQLSFSRENLPGDHESFIVSGKTLEQFVWFVETVLCREEPDVSIWKPTLWAHNGSKFDVKFVFDYYINVLDFELSGPQYVKDYGVAAIGPTKDGGWKKMQYNMKKAKTAKMTSMGSKILTLRIGQATYRCSHAHHTAPLRNLPAIFDLDPNLVAKGEFPYRLLKPENWTLVCTQGLPPLALYDISSMTVKRRKEVARWWIDEQFRRRAERTYVLTCLVEADLEADEIDSWMNPGWPVAEGAPVPWHFEKELWDYLFNDVIVLGRSMEAYHRKAVELHEKIWTFEIPADHEHQRKVISPLTLATAPSWAYAMYTTWFMPPDTLFALRPNEHKFVRAALRGGRTDKRCNYVEITPERRAQGDRMVYYDFKSLYPSVQDCSIHDTHFPVGIPWWVNHRTPIDPVHYGDWRAGIHNNQSLVEIMEDLKYTGFLEVDARCTKYVTHPTLHVKARPDNAREDDLDEKLLFRNADVEKQTYAWPELKEAIRCGEIEVTKLHQALIFQRGTDVFGKYVKFFFRVKDEAEGTNEGLRSLAKLFLNSLWGKLGQRSQSIKEWVISAERMDYIFERFRSGEWEFISAQKRKPHKTFFEYRIKDDIRNHYSTAPHIAAFVSMWGRVVLHQKVLSVHGQRALYCDTDSAIIYLRAGDEVLWTGNDIGQLTNELPDILKKAGHDKRRYPYPYILEFVAAAPKTYALAIKHDDPPLLDRSKVVCKGFEPTWNNARAINYHTMKELMYSRHALKPHFSRKRPLDPEETAFVERLCIKEKGKHVFRSRVSTNQAVPVQVTVAKALTGIYTKGRDHPTEPCLVIPFGLDPPSHETFLDFTDDTRHYD